MTRKLINEQDSSTFEKAFSNAARLPTEEDSRKAMEKSFRDIAREDLHRDSAYQPPSFGAPRSSGRNGWANEVPLRAPEGISLIDKIVDHLAPQPTPRVNIASLKGIDEGVVRAKLEDACAKGKITKAQLEEALRALGGDAS